MSTIHGFGTVQGMGGMEGMQRNTTLTDDQKSSLQSILSQYDPSNLTSDDAKSIFEQLRKAGIHPGKGLKDALESSGFSMKALRSLIMQGIQQAQNAQGPNSTQSAVLTDDQKATVVSILSNYDSKNITASDAKAIFQSFSDAGIKPQKGLKEAIESSGFDAEKLRSLAMPPRVNEGHFWASQNSSQGINTSSLQSLKSILEKYDLTNLSSEDQTSLTSALQNAGLLQSGNILNLGV